MSITDEYNLALQLYNTGKLTQAKQGFLCCLKQQPNFFNAHFMLGNIYLQLQEYKESLRAYKKALQLNPTFTPTYNNIANIFTLANQNKKALKYLKLALKQNKTCTGTLYNLANFYKKALNLTILDH